MPIRIICGKSGTGKTTYCFNEIKQKENLEEKIYIITPEQFSFSAEKQLLETLGKKSIINVEVLNFKRMAERISQEVGENKKILITDAGKAMLINSILQKEKFTFLGNSAQNIDLILNTISELKKHAITEEKIEETKKNIKNKYLEEKIKDIEKIYKLYQESLSDKYIDEEDKLTKLEKQIQMSNMFKNTHVYIDEFNGFTSQEYNIIKTIESQAKSVTITICSDNLNMDTTPETDIFYYNKKAIQRLTEGVQIEKSVILTENNRFKNKELQHLEQNLIQKVLTKFNQKNEHIRLFLATNPYSQIEYVAKQIIKLVRDKGLNYNQIAVIAKNIEQESSLVKAIFSKYNIPVFIDEKNELLQNIIAKYILSIIEIFEKNWTNEAIFNYLKLGFTELEVEEIYKLENYCVKNGINRSKWYNSTWKENEELRKTVVEPLIKLKTEINKNKTVKEITKEIYNFLITQKAYETMEKKIEKLEQQGEIIIANQYKNSMQILANTFDEIVMIFGEEKITFEKYKEILKIGLSYKKLGKIPQALDQVILGDTERTRNHNIKAIFIINVNDGIFPSRGKAEGFLNDKDRETLKENGVELANGVLENLYQEQFNIYRALTTSEEDIFITYPTSDKEGKALRPSSIITKLKKIFVNLQEESDIIKKFDEITTQQATFDELIINMRKLSKGEEINPVWHSAYNWYLENKQWKEKLKQAEKGIEYTNKAEPINQELIKQLYGNKIKTSISKLEQYKKCPFSFHLKYGLKLQEKEEFKIKPIDTGNFMHEVLDEFFRKEYKIKTLTQTELDEILEEIIDEKLKLNKNTILTSTPKFRVLTNKLKKVVKQSITYIVEQLKNSEFEILASEVEFSQDLGNVELVGKVDRLDIGEIEGKQYIRIIDYKSSAKNIDLNNVLAGVQIQLLTYIDIMEKQQKKEPAAILYFNLIEPIIANAINLNPEEIEQKIREKFRANGLLLADINVIKQMDRNLKTGKSNALPVTLDKDGNIMKSRSSVLTREEFTTLREKTIKIIKQISKEILTGNIEIKPTYNKKDQKTACEFCQYKTVCGFNRKYNSYEYIANKTKEEILKEITKKGE